MILLSTSLTVSLIVLITNILIGVKQHSQYSFINETLDFLTKNKKIAPFSLKSELFWLKIRIITFSILLFFQITIFLLAITIKIYYPLSSGDPNVNFIFLVFLILPAFLLYSSIKTFMILKTKIKNYKTNMNKDGDWENYYISIEKINLNDPKFRFIDEYFLGNNIKLNKIFSVSNTFFNTFPTFKKLNKKLSKIESINDRIDFIDHLMFAKPSTFQVDNNILDLEQVSLLRYKLIELANNLK